MAIGKINGISIAGGGGGGGGSTSLNFAFFDSTVRDVYCPWVGETENTSLQRYNRWIAPQSLTLSSMSFVRMTTTVTTGNIQWIAEVYDGAILNTSETQTVTAPITIWQYYTVNFSTITLTTGQIFALKMINSNTGGVAAGNIAGTVLFN